jgi:ribonuclease III family protein
VISDELGLLELSSPTHRSSEIQRLAPAAFAYLGDAVYELYIRRRYLLPPKRSEDYHRQVVSQVRAESQAAHLRSLMPHLSESEHEFVKRGRNAAQNRPKRLDPEIYQHATSFEALIGYLYLTSPDRLFELLGLLDLQ